MNEGQAPPFVRLHKPPSDWLSVHKTHSRSPQLADRWDDVTPEAARRTRSADKAATPSIRGRENPAAVRAKSVREDSHHTGWKIQSKRFRRVVYPVRRYLSNPSRIPSSPPSDPCREHVCANLALLAIICAQMSTPDSFSG